MIEGSFSQNVVKQFKKNKLAKAGLYVVVFLFFVAIFAPLLANNKPIFIYAQLKQKYIKSYTTQKFLLQSLLLNLSKIKQNKTKENVKRGLKTFLNNAPSMENHLQEKDIKKFKTHIIQIKKGFKNVLSTTTFKADLKKQNENVRGFIRTFNPKQLELKRTLSFPAIRALKPLDIFFIFLFILTCFYKSINKLIKIIIKKIKYPLNEFKPYLRVGFILIPALFFAFIWAVSVTPKNDKFNYKSAIKNMTQSDYYMMPLVPFGENENILEHSREAPSWLLSREKTKNRKYSHFLGTDTNGRDVLARIIYGSRISMSVGFVAVSIYVLIGIILGSLAGYYRGTVDILISRFIEIMMTFPVFFLILIVLAMLKPSIMNIMVVIGITGWTGVARLTRGEFLKLVGRDFVTAAKALGAKSNRIIFKHILPNALGPVLVAATFGIAGAILTESALSFLGFGVPQPTASWGDILNNGRNSIHATWWLTIFPGFMIFITITAYNLVGEGIRDAMDPRLKK